jgi:predicted dehydrogenase
MNRRTVLLASLATMSVGFSSTPRIRIGQVGTTHAHASGKMDALRSLGDLYEVVGLVEPDSKHAEQAQKSKTYAGLNLLTEDALLATPRLQAVAVETEIEDGAATAMRCLRAAKHVHLDKPGALDHAEFAAMRREAEKSGLTVQMGYMLRYNPAFEFLYRIHRAGWLGEIREIDAMMGKLAGPGTRKKIGELPGGGMFELGCHIIDAAVYLLGKPAAVHAFSTPSQNDGVKDNQLAVLEYPKATATIRCNHTDPHGGPRRRFMVAGSKGAVEILPLESGNLTLHLNEAHEGYKKGQQNISFEVPKGRYDGEFMDLAKVIRGEKALAWDAAHDIAVHETVMKASA